MTITLDLFLLSKLVDASRTPRPPRDDSLNFVSTQIHLHNLL